jgi:hypothetical protein
MSFILLVVGILATAVGVITVGFGIPINEFSLGNTLIIAGTTALMGGLIVIGLALALRQLGQLAALLNARPVTLPSAAPAPHAADTAELPAVPRSVAAPRPSAPTPARAEPPRPPRAAPRFEPEPSEAEASEPLAPPPLAARPPLRPAPAPAPADEVPSWRPPRPAPEPQVRKEAPRVAPPPERHAPETEYDAIWPAERRASAPRIDPVPEPAESRAAEPARPEPASVLKSGVVDGMAYTLYTDGSIEAELAQGVVRFGSIEELRNHLEKSAS